ncbi:HPP family protein [Flavobacterium subsaxonicum]|uniref:HPP family protein n=1 Tax=Flavobacterium subsaxonicum WB 4.1-42 = DSM 21790 TaxID=1121898 RepID=A0A0A2MNE9_9FLAO|nr:HPP family protein [Flavobacterium subsaxonicum]KGO93091.1 HPP family protein [Flavobacterium subsaxonicum WB 4.1-42 = DSM 21790]
MPIKKIKRTYRHARYVFYKETLVDFKEHFWAFVGSFIGLGTITFLQYKMFSPQDVVLLVGSFGASCVLVYGVILSPLAQPRNLIGGHVISALIGVTIQKLLPETVWIAAPLAVSLSIIFMQITKTLHPPGGATALIAVTGSAQIKALGYMYVLSPVLSGAVILLIAALIFNNIHKHRQYPSPSAIKNIKLYGKRIKRLARR